MQSTISAVANNDNLQITRPGLVALTFPLHLGIISRCTYNIPTIMMLIAWWLLGFSHTIIHPDQLGRAQGIVDFTTHIDIYSRFIAQHTSHAGHLQRVWTISSMKIILTGSTCMFPIAIEAISCLSLTLGFSEWERVSGRLLPRFHNLPPHMWGTFPRVPWTDDLHGQPMVFRLFNVIFHSIISTIHWKGVEIDIDLRFVVPQAVDTMFTMSVEKCVHASAIHPFNLLASVPILLGI